MAEWMQSACDAQQQLVFVSHWVIVMAVHRLVLKLLR
jgi:hypothetical protein